MDGKNKLKVIAVNWVDPFSVDEWENLEFILDQPKCEIVTCGILVNDKGDNYIIAGNVDLNFDDLSCVMVIPKKYVTRRRVIGYVKR